MDRHDAILLNALNVLVPRTAGWFKEAAGLNLRVEVGFGGDIQGICWALPMGKQPVVERASAGPVVAGTFVARIHVDWDDGAPVTPLGGLARWRSIPTTSP
jgi:hypothetical protein